MFRNRDDGAISAVMGFAVIALSITVLLVAAVVAQQQKTTDVTRENIVDDVTQAVLVDMVNHLETTTTRNVSLIPDGLCREGSDHGVPWEWCVTARDEDMDFRGGGLDVAITLQMPTQERHFVAHLSGGVAFLDNNSVGNFNRADPFLNGWITPGIWNRDLGFVADRRLHHLGPGSNLHSYTAGSGNPTAGAPVAATGAYLQVPASRFVQWSGQHVNADNYPLGMPEGEYACEGPGCATTSFTKAAWQLRGVTATLAQWVGSPTVDGANRCTNPKVFQTSKAPGGTLAIPSSGYVCFSHLIFDANTTITGSGVIQVGGFVSSHQISVDGTVNVAPNVRVNAATTWPDARNVVIATASDIILSPGSRIAATLVGEEIHAQDATIYGSAYAGEIYANGATLYWQRELKNSPLWTDGFNTWSRTNYRWALLPTDATITGFREVHDAP